MTKVLYRTVLSDAWSTTWRNKSFWLWGLFVGLLGNAGEYQFVLTAANEVANREAGVVSSTFMNMPVRAGVFGGLFHAFTSDPFSTFMLLVIGLVAIGLAIFFIWLTMVSVIALVNGTAALAANKKAPTMAESVAVGNTFFGSVLLTYVFGRLIIWFLLTLLALLGALSLFDYYIGFPLFLAGFLVILPTLFIVSFIVRYTIMFVVIRRQPILEAVESALDLFRRHWLITLELGFFLFLINLVVGIIMVALIGLLVAPFFVAAIVAWQQALVTWAVLLASFSVILFLAILFTFGSALGAYQWAAWTHLFTALKERGHASKIVRIFSKLLSNRPVRLPGASR